MLARATIIFVYDITRMDMPMQVHGHVIRFQSRSVSSSIYGITTTAYIAPLKWREVCKVLRQL